MAWYYYNGTTIRPVEVDENKTKSVRPHTKVNIVKMGPLGKSLLNKKLLTRTSKPVDFQPEEETVVDSPKIEDVVKVSAWAKAVVEKGTVNSDTDLVGKINDEAQISVNVEQNGQNSENSDTINNDGNDTENSVIKKKRKLHRQGNA